MFIQRFDRFIKTIIVRNSIWNAIPTEFYCISILISKNILHDRPIGDSNVLQNFQYTPLYSEIMDHIKQIFMLNI